MAIVAASDSAPLRGQTVDPPPETLSLPRLRDRIDVNYVEAYTSVTRRGRPVGALSRDEFRIFEDGVEQTILRFEPPAQQALHLLVLVDVSDSMENQLSEVRGSVLRFLRRNLRRQDRTAIVAFRGRARLRVPWTSDLERVERGLRGLETKGATALYDALAASLRLFDGVTDRRALFVFSDGRDEGSALDFAGAIERVRRSRVPVFTVGLVPRSDPRGAPERLRRLARETGGRSFLVGDAGGLGSILEEVHRELQQQYLLTYQSSADGGDDFREIEVRVDREGVEARTLRGYYP